MKFHIRPFDFSDSDYQTAIQLRNQLYPDTPTTVDIWLHNDQSRRLDPSYHFFVAEELDGPLVGFVQCAKLHSKSPTFGIGLIGRDSTWQNGVMAELLTWVKQTAAEHSVAKIVQKVQESEALKLKFLKRSGFQQVMKHPLSALDVASFDSTPFEHTLSTLLREGIRVEPLSTGWHHQPEWQSFIHHLDWQLMADVPHHEERFQDTLEDFVKNELLHPNAFPESYFIAWDGDQPVGLTCFVKRGGQVKTVSTALTGVLKSHRRKGIATALKISSILFAQKAGCQTILTKNEENNPMYSLNQQLGFVAKPAWLDMRLTL